MEIFGVHLCQDEIMPMMAAVPALSAFYWKLRARFSKKHSCGHVHVCTAPDEAGLDASGAVSGVVQERKVLSEAGAAVEATQLVLTPQARSSLRLPPK